MLRYALGVIRSNLVCMGPERRDRTARSEVLSADLRIIERELSDVRALKRMRLL